MGFSGQVYWSGLSFSSIGDLPDPGIQPGPPACHALAGRLFTTEPPGKPFGHATLHVFRHLTNTSSLSEYNNLS